MRYQGKNYRMMRLTERWDYLSFLKKNREEAQVEEFYGKRKINLCYSVTVFTKIGKYLCRDKTDNYNNREILYYIQD